MYRISKEFHFSASHRLHHLAPEHPCARLHGHNYVVIVELGAGLLTGESFVKDYNELKPFQRWIDEVVDHRHILGLMDDATKGTTMFLLANTPADVVASEQEQIELVRGGAENSVQPATAENIARAIFRMLRSMGWSEVTEVRVSETPKTWAAYAL